MGKPFKTYEELVAKLRNEKKLCIPDEERVIMLLKKYSYFSLVSGYKMLFKQPNGEYLPGTTIDDLLALYEFDDKLRNIFFRAIQMIETHIKSLLSYAFVEKYGEDQDEYLNAKNYAVLTKEKYAKIQNGEIDKLIGILKEQTSPPFKQKYLFHQWCYYDNIPLWVTLKALSFGVASKMYSFCTQDIQTTISREFKQVSRRQLVCMLRFLTKVRNVCAHNERLYDFNETVCAIQAMPLHAQLKIGKRKGKSQYKKGQQDLFAAIVCFKYLLEPEEFCSVVEEIEAEINLLCTKTKKIPKNKILSCMGFPPNWKDSVYF